MKKLPGGGNRWRRAGRGRGQAYLEGNRPRLFLVQEGEGRPKVDVFLFGRAGRRSSGGHGESEAA